MKLIRVLDSSGDTRVEFEPQTTAENEAKALFERLTGNGAAAFAVNRADGQPDKKLKGFGEIENETVIIPRVIGG